MDDVDSVDDSTGDVRAPLVLVVDPDPIFASLVEACLDFEGAVVESAATLAQAHEAVHPGLTGVVVDSEMPDGAGIEIVATVAARCPTAVVVVCVDRDRAAPAPAGHDSVRVVTVDKGDLARVAEVLGLEPEHAHLPEDRLLHITALERE